MDLLEHLDRAVCGVERGKADQRLVPGLERQRVDRLVQLGLVPDVEALVPAKRTERRGGMTGRLLQPLGEAGLRRVALDLPSQVPLAACRIWAMYPAVSQGV